MPFMFRVREERRFFIATDGYAFLSAVVPGRRGIHSHHVRVFQLQKYGRDFFPALAGELFRKVCDPAV